MKHNLKVTLLLVGLFLIAQVIGLIVTDYYLIKALPYNIERPQLEERTSFVPIFFMIVFVTALALILIRLKMRRFWMVWFLLSVIFTLLISFSAFIEQRIALALAIVLALIKVFQRNIYVHNITELFIYGGLAAIFVPILSLFSIIILLILVSLYDMYAVWKSKFMIKLAKFQASEIKVFAGLLIPYNKNKQAILGGGDIGFPLLFSGVILKLNGFVDAFVISLFASLALLVLLHLGKKNKFYPAMPFLTTGCFIGYFVSLLV